MVEVSAADFLWFVDQALDDMVAIVRGLGDDLANRQPELPGANSPYAILTHCLGVMEYWGGHVVAGRPSSRDRESEFRAEGQVVDLVRQTAAARRQLEEDLATAESAAPPHNPPDEGASELPLGRTQGAVFLHIFEELKQHLGQLELTRDLLRAGG